MGQFGKQCCDLGHALVPFAGGQPAGDPVEVLTGFLSGAGEAQGRPVGVAMDRNRALLVADDVGNTVWKVTGFKEQDRGRAAEFTCSWAGLPARHHAASVGFAFD